MAAMSFVGPMACTRAVVVVLGSLLAFTQTEVEAGVAHAQVFSSRSGAAQSQVTEPDGTIKGECAYLDPEGNSVKISYRQSPGGQIEAESDPPQQNAAAALETCRRAADAAAKVAQDSIQETQEQLFHSLPSFFHLPSPSLLHPARLLHF
ncbi:uncharacterized protein LOC135114961 isoform X4 [Scylla paramamosain]